MRTGLLWGMIAIGLSGLAGAAQSEARGVVEGRLRACPSSPNCVSSQASDASRRVEPLTIEGDADASILRLAQVIRAMPRTEVRVVGNGYLRAEFTSRLFGWVDDLEAFAIPNEGVIHLRSASRVGYWDLGANRRRIEELRERFSASID